MSRGWGQVGAGGTAGIGTDGAAAHEHPLPQAPPSPNPPPAWPPQELNPEARLLPPLDPPELEPGGLRLGAVP